MVVRVEADRVDKKNGSLNFTLATKRVPNAMHRKTQPKIENKFKPHLN